MNSFDLVKLIAGLADDRKAKDPVVLDLKSLTIVADYFAIFTGTSRTQVLGICDHIEQELTKLGREPIHRERDLDARWVLLDYADVIIHVFQDEARQLYNLERLWNEAGRVAVNGPAL